MRTHPTLLSSADEIRDLAKVLQVKDMIAFDTEFIRENTFYPVVEIIQVATDEESWLVDAAAFKKGYAHGPPRPGKQGYDPGIEPLLEVFQSRSILKILHAAQGDQECLFTSFGIVATPTLDSAVAASLCGLGEGIGLGKLLKARLGVSIAKGHARTNWAARPLPSQLIEYAHSDVMHLVKLGQELLSDLDRLGRRGWSMELSAKWEDKVAFEPHPHEIAEKLARGGRLDAIGFSALIELVTWREERVRQLNLPRRWVADDAVLLDLAHVRPKDMEHLATFRGLNKGELKNSGEAILEALRKASLAAAGAKGRAGVVRAAKQEFPSPEESLALDLLRCFIAVLADRHQIAPRHLIAGDRLLPLLRRKAQNREDLVSLGILTQASALLIGDELLAFIRGERALSVQDFKIHVREVMCEK